MKKQLKSGTKFREDNNTSCSNKIQKTENNHKNEQIASFLEMT